MRKQRPDVVSGGDSVVSPFAYGEMSCGDRARREARRAVNDQREHDPDAQRPDRQHSLKLLTQPCLLGF